MRGDAASGATRFGPAASLARFGESIFSTMSRLATQHSAVNLGQGFPDFEPPDFVVAAAKRALEGGFSQYGRSFGLPVVNSAISDHLHRSQGLRYDPDSEICVTAGCTEAIAAALLGLVNPGDEVVMMDPCYDSYAPCVAVAGGVSKRVPLTLPGFTIDASAVRQACTGKTRVIIINSPHNPTGRVFSAAELSAIAEISKEFNCAVISDEVYECITFGGAHRSIAALPGMRERTLVLSSLGKTFSCTGYKIGWAAGPSGLVEATKSAHQFLTFCSPTPLQAAGGEALRSLESYLPTLQNEYLVRRQAMLEGLAAAGFQCVVPEGSYFIVGQYGHLSAGNDLEAATMLVKEAGVATIPVSAFCANPRTPTGYLRFAFCKRESTIFEACRRLEVFARGRGGAA